MNKTKFIVLLAVLISFLPTANAQEETPAKFKFYGFIRNFTAYDTRDCKSGTQDLYFYTPLDYNFTDKGVDLNANPSFRNLAITSRLGLDITGYKYGQLAINGKIETDFYSMNGSTAILRLRQAYADIKYAYPSGNSFDARIGQAWHPMAVDLPHGIALESGAPFTPFNRSPQIMLNHVVRHHTFTLGAIYQMQYQSTGPNGKSSDYMKYGLLPEIYAGVTYKNGNFLSKIGINMLSIKPRWKDANGPVSDRITTFSHFAFAQYTSGLFQLKAKTLLAKNGEHMNILTGYGVSSINNDGSFSYTPMKTSTSYISASYGKKVQILGMIGYLKHLGTKEDVYTTMFYTNTSAPVNLNQMFRLTPTILWNLGKLALGVEYDYTSVEFGENMNNRGIYTDNLHWVSNNRILTMIKYSF